MIRLSEQDLNNILKRGHCSVTGENILKQVARRGRVQSRKTEIDGHLFASKSEALIYSEFKLDPDIEILELQPQFILLKPFKRKNKAYRGITYKADFKIRLKDVIWIIEVKSKGTLKANSKSYAIRRKLFLHNFPNLNFREIIFDGQKREIKEYK